LTDVKLKEKTLQLIIQRMALVKVKEGEEIILSSGRKSNYYFDMKKVIMKRDIRPILADVIWNKIKDDEISAIGGLEVGAIPIIDIMIDFYYKINHGFYIRKEPKKYGLMKRVEGFLFENDRILIVDDVATSGDTIVKCIDVIQEERKGKIVKVLVIVDRLEGAKELIEEKGYKLEHIFTVKDFEI